MGTTPTSISNNPNVQVKPKKRAASPKPETPASGYTKWVYYWSIISQIKPKSDRVTIMYVRRWNFAKKKKEIGRQSSVEGPLELRNICWTKSKVVHHEKLD